MDKFTAGNGVEVSLNASMFGGTYLAGRKLGNLCASAGPEGISALREFFQAERDEELARWRDPSHPGIFAAGFAHNPDVVQIVKEEGGTAYAQYRRNELGASAFDPMTQVAIAYFTAHPEQKPWDSASEGDVWELTVRGTPRLYVKAERGFRNVARGAKFADRRNITDGYLVWKNPKSE